MRICLISREYPPDSGWGGIGTYTYYQAHALKELGHDVEVVALAASNNGSIKSGEIMEEGILVHRIMQAELMPELEMLRQSTPFTHFVLSNIVSLSRAIFRIHSEKPFDVAEAPEHLAEGLCPSLVKLMPLVIRLHTPQSKFIAEGFHNLRSSFDQEFVAMMERVAMLSADLISSPSEDIANYISTDFSYPRETIKIIRNPVDNVKFTPEGPRAFGKEGIVSVLFVGRLEERKGVQFLVPAIPKIVSQCKNVEFIVIGADTNNATGQKSMLAFLQNMLAENNCASHVKFLPFVPLNELPNYYRAADIFVFPSLYDNAPCTVLESMASGRPVVTSDAGGAREYMVDGESGIVVASRNSEQLAEAIIALAKDTQKREAIGKAARQRVLDLYTAKDLAEQSVGAYQEAIEKYETKQSKAAYSRAPERFNDDLESMLLSYNKMLYDFRYRYSFSFRLMHRVRKLCRLASGDSSRN